MYSINPYVKRHFHLNTTQLMIFNVNRISCLLQFYNKKFQLYQSKLIIGCTQRIVITCDIFFLNFTN